MCVLGVGSKRSEGEDADLLVRRSSALVRCVVVVGGGSRGGRGERLRTCIVEGECIWDGVLLRDGLC